MPRLEKPRAKLIMVNIPVPDQERGREFYEALTGLEFARSLWNETSFHAPVSAGVQVELSAPHLDGQPMMATFAVQNLDDTLSRLEGMGAKVWERDITLEFDARFRNAVSNDWKRIFGKEPGEKMGRAAAVMDPFGNNIALIEMQEWAEASFRRGHLDLDREGDVHATAMRKGQELFPEEAARARGRGRPDSPGRGPGR